MSALKQDWATWPQWILLGLIICTFFVDACAVWQCSPFVTGFLLDRGLTERWAGMFYGLNVLSAMCGTLLSPLLIKASSQTTVLLIGTSFAFIASVMMTYTPNSLWWTSFGSYLIGLRILMGFGEGMLQVGGISLAMRIAPESKVPLFAALSEGMRSLGSLVGPFMGGALFEAGGWALPFGVISIALGLNLGLLLVFVRMAALGPSVQPKAVDTWVLLSKPPVWICSLLIFTITLPIALCQPLFEPYLTDEPFRLTPGGVGIVFGLIALVDTVSAVLTGGTSLLVGQLELIVISLLMLIGGCFIIALGPKVRRRRA